MKNYDDYLREFVDILTKHPTSRPIYTKYPYYYLGY